MIILLYLKIKSGLRGLLPDISPNGVRCIMLGVIELIVVEERKREKRVFFKNRE